MWAAQCSQRQFFHPFASVYAHYVAMAEKKGRTKAAVNGILRWLDCGTDIV